MNKNILILLIIAMIFAGCEKLFEPIDENRRTLENIYDNPSFAEGLLLNAYTRLPTNYYSFTEVATDDAVTNDKFSGLLNMATGQWSAINNPVSQWANAYTAIMYLNIFLEETDEVEWSYTSETANRLFNERHKGEAYALRALYMFYLLQSHGGYSPSGELLGVPIITEVLDANAEFKKPRNTFEECMQQIYSDLSKAEEFLPLDYKDLEDKSLLPARYSDVPVVEYNRVFGDVNRQRVSGRIAKGIKAKAALLAASPAFTDGNSTTWEHAANFAAELIKLNGGVGSIDPKGHTFYKAAQVNALNLARNNDQPEMLWRANRESGTGTLYREENNFPPTLYGNGRVNPTQNLVEAFPMANGYPINHPNSGYNAGSPYAGRDPRLNEYIIYNGGSFGGSAISISTSNNAVDAINTSTRTGYYLKKLLREDVNLNPTSRTTRLHYQPHIRYTEIFLAYAEAANEAWGPDASPHGFSARDVVSAIRKRAGISQPDSYLSSVGSKEEMRNLIRNERRLELCFEGFRFWDLRRWKANLSEPAKGIRVSNGAYVIGNVENRYYSDHMQYGPLPHYEVLKMDLTQNVGW